MQSSRLKAYFLISLCLASFGYGVAADHYQVFPFSTLQNATRAWRALRGEREESDLWYEQSDQNVEEVQGLTEPTVRRNSAGAGEELILVSGGEGFLPQHNPKDGCVAWIMNRRGKVLHVWRYDPEIWAHLEKAVTAPGQKSGFVPIGLHLYPNGDLLIACHGIASFPSGLGLAKFDKDSNLLWKKESLSHHWFSVTPDGRIITPGTNIVDAPCDAGDTRYWLTSPDGKILRDTVQILDSNGVLLEEIDVLDAVIASGWVGLLPVQTSFTLGTGNNERFRVSANDPIHLNCVQLVTPELAATHPQLSAGDLMLSMRNLNAVGILDPRTKRFKWMTSGAFAAQHSPRFYRDGVLLFDNRGGSMATGGSRLVHIDLETRTPQVVFPLPSSELPGYFFSSWAGCLEVGDSDRALVTFYLSQKIWEVDLKSSEVVWEYVCVDPEQHRRRFLSTAQYVGDVQFSFNQESSE
jgi:hypothetical protein